MKTIAFVLALLTARLFAADAPAPAAVFPSELKLSNGVTLHHATPTRWASDYVVVKHANGIDPVQYRYIAPEQRPVVLAMKEQAAAAAPTPAPLARTAPTAPTNTTLEGQAFIVTRGAGNYKLGGMLIYVFPAERLKAFDGYATVELGEPTTTATTDADGKFRLKLADDGEFFLFARVSRLTGASRESYEWIVLSAQITDRSNVLLSSNNNREPTRQVKIGK